jgi:hypothetical protein
VSWGSLLATRLRPAGAMSGRKTFIHGFRDGAT